FQLEVSRGRTSSVQDPQRYFRSRQMHASLVVAPDGPVHPVIQPPYFAVQVAIKRGRAVDDLLYAHIRVVDALCIKLRRTSHLDISSCDFDFDLLGGHYLDST